MLTARMIGVVALAGAWSAALMPAAEGNGESVEVLQLRPNFYMVAGAGGNIGVQIGTDGIVLVDAGKKEASGEVLAAIRKLSNEPIRYLIDTNADADHVGGNAEIAKAGQTLFPTDARAAQTKAMTGGGASIIAEEDVLKRMSAPTGRESSYPDEAWPTETFYQPRNYIYLNHEGIEMFHQAAAHTDGDTVVFFRISDVVVAGDVLDTTRFPVIDLAKGGSIQGEITALNHLIELAIPPGPLPFQDGGTWVIPGHGRLCDQADVLQYRDMVVIIRDVIADMIKRGMTLDQIKEASPAKPYAREYGSGSGPGSTNDFIEAVYRSLTAKK